MNLPAAPSSKLPQVGTTIFSVMSKMAADYNAINLSQGFPDFPVDEALINLVHKHMRDGHNQYAPMQGVPALREAISVKMQKCYGKTYDPNTEITITSGATQAIYTAITALVKEGDQVLIFNPAYDCYIPPVLLNGGIPIHHELRAPYFKPNWDEVKKVVSRRTKLIIVNSPHNPSGFIWAKEDMIELEKLVVATGAYVLSDEVYEHIVFDGAMHQSAARFEALAAHSLIVASFGKTFHATGWKLGYICGPSTLMAEFQKVHQFLVFSANTPMQYAIAEYLQDARHYEGISDMYQRRRDLFINALHRSRFTLLPSEGTYFQLLNYSAISKKKEVKFAEELTQKHGVASIPVSVFYPKAKDQFLLRFCFAKGEETLLRAAERLCAL
jgi:methionine aminotransferase